MEIFFITLVRLVLPLSILRWPLFGIFLSMYLDFIDFRYFEVQSQEEMNRYQIWDKFMDTYYFALAAYKSLGWKETLARRISIFSFFYRVAGVVIFLIVNDRSVILFFPNFFENFFIFYLLFQTFTKNQSLFTGTFTNIIVIASIFLPKLAAEYYLHILHSPRILNLSREPIAAPLFPASPEGIVLYGSYLGPTILVLILMIFLARRRPAKEVA